MELSRTEWRGQAGVRDNWDVQSCVNIFKEFNLRLTADSIKFCRRVGEKGQDPRPMVIGFNREHQKEDLLDRARDLRNTAFNDVSVVPDLTQEQRKDEAEMVKETERRNQALNDEDKAKNLEWIVVDMRGERRIIKGVRRTMRGAGSGGIMRGGARATDTVARRMGTALLESGGRGRGGSVVVTGGGTGQEWTPIQGARTRTNSKRNRGDRSENDSEDERTGPSQPGAALIGMAASWRAPRMQNLALCTKWPSALTVSPTVLMRLPSQPTPRSVASIDS